jgi:H+-translocating NAD(P) transhydrogenase subunit alpha
LDADNSTISWLAIILAGVAIFLATLNVVGGFVVTQRMLNKFKGKKSND